MDLLKRTNFTASLSGSGVGLSKKLPEKLDSNLALHSIGHVQNIKDHKSRRWLPK
jgi:hypothetical protein